MEFTKRTTARMLWPVRQFRLLVVSHQGKEAAVLRPALSRSQFHSVEPRGIYLVAGLIFCTSYTVDFAPVFPSLAIPELEGLELPFLSYYPRCLRRDVSVWVSSNWTKDIDSYNLITTNGSNIYWFQQNMQGNGFVGGFMGVHSAGSGSPSQSLVRCQRLTSLRTLHNWRRSGRRLLCFSRRPCKSFNHGLENCTAS